MGGEIKIHPSDLKSITPAQVRAARGLLGWSTAELAQRAGVGSATISRFENGSTRIEGRTTLRAVTAALEAAGVRFLEAEEFPALTDGVALVASTGQRPSN